jgi:hypothetical protein
MLSEGEACDGEFAVNGCSRLFSSLANYFSPSARIFGMPEPMRGSRRARSSFFSIVAQTSGSLNFSCWSWNELRARTYCSEKKNRYRKEERKTETLDGVELHMMRIDRWSRL